MKLRFLITVFSILAAFNLCLAQEEVSLDQVISLALEKNYDVRISQAISESANTTNRFAGGGFLPQINGVASTVWNSNTQQVRFTDANRNNKGQAEANTTSASLQLVWTLFDGTRMFATRERIAQLAEQGELALKAQMVNTIAAIINNYYDVVRQKQQLLAIQEQMGVSQERVKLAEKKLQVGTGIKPELLQARVDLNAQRAQAIQQETIIAQLKYQLNTLVGSRLPEVYDVADTILINLDLVPDESFQNIENTNYTLLTTRKNLNIANLVVRERRAEYLPFLNFNASYNYLKNNNTKLINTLSPIFNQSAGLNYGFSATLPIFNGFNTRRLNQLSRIEVNRQELLYEQQKTTIDASLRSAFINYDNAKKILLIEEETIGAAKENVAIALETFKRGVTTSVELRIAQQSLADAYNRLITARYNAKVAETELMRLNGKLLK
jgi:outer membrane protein